MFWVILRCASLLVPRAVRVVVVSAPVRLRMETCNLQSTNSACHSLCLVPVQLKRTGCAAGLYSHVLIDDTAHNLHHARLLTCCTDDEQMQGHGTMLDSAYQ